VYIYLEFSYSRGTFFLVLNLPSKLSSQSRIRRRRRVEGTQSMIFFLRHLLILIPGT
jgi:hypothetical protein